MKCLSKDCKCTALLMTVELCYPCSRIIEHNKRNWVSLTKADVESWILPESPTIYEFAQYVEEKIKIKNT